MTSTAKQSRYRPGNLIHPHTPQGGDRATKPAASLETRAIWTLVGTFMPSYYEGRMKPKVSMRVLDVGDS